MSYTAVKSSYNSTCLNKSQFCFFFLCTSTWQPNICIDKYNNYCTVVVNNSTSQSCFPHIIVLLYPFITACLLYLICIMCITSVVTKDILFVFHLLVHKSVIYLVLQTVALFTMQYTYHFIFFYLLPFETVCFTLPFPLFWEESVQTAFAFATNTPSQFFFGWEMERMFNCYGIIVSILMHSPYAISILVSMLRPIIMFEKKKCVSSVNN